MVSGQRGHPDFEQTEGKSTLSRVDKKFSAIFVYLKKRERNQDGILSKQFVCVSWGVRF